MERGRLWCRRPVEKDKADLANSQPGKTAVVERDCGTSEEQGVSRRGKRIFDNFRLLLCRLTSYSRSPSVALEIQVTRSSKG